MLCTEIAYFLMIPQLRQVFLQEELDIATEIAVNLQYRCREVNVLHISVFLKLTKQTKLTIDNFIFLLKSNKTIFIYFQICIAWVDEVATSISSPGFTVKVNESMFGHRKYYRGWLLKGQWVLRRFLTWFRKSIFDLRLKPYRKNPDQCH